MADKSESYYEILQISPSTDQEGVELAFRKLAKKFHPDINQSPDATEYMQQINEAYEVLYDPR